MGQRLAETGDVGSAGGAEVGAWGLAAVTQGDQAYSPSSPSSSTWSAQLGFELRGQVCGRKGLSARRGSHGLGALRSHNTPYDPQAASQAPLCDPGLTQSLP